MKACFYALIVAVALAATGCAPMMTAAGSGLAGNLNKAILNHDDPQLVRDGAPAYLLMLDSFVEGSPNNEAMLSAAAELYAAYGIVFVDDPARARRLTSRARAYGRRALCVAEAAACGAWELAYPEFVERLQQLESGDAPVLFTFGLSWIAYIQAHGDDWGALARLPQVKAVLTRVSQLDPDYQPANVAHYLAVLDTIRPPALGGDFDSGLAHYQRAIALSGGRDLAIKVDFARYYARTLYDRDLHDRLLKEVLEADPAQPGYVLFNTLAQHEARELLDSADDYF
ncbi:MAG: TRAP transporter TatT component family protein [Xanthomonadales bacterium]|nr:TRAP transporter TatT component family protein [Xanthomonadales bacterium]